MANPTLESHDVPKIEPLETVTVEKAASVDSYGSSLGDGVSVRRRRKHLLSRLRSKFNVDAQCGVGTVLIMHGVLTIGWITGSVYASAKFEKEYWIVLACTGVVFLVPILVAPIGLCTRKPTPVRIYCITACFRAVAELILAMYAFTIIPHCSEFCLETGIPYKWNFLIGTVFLTCCFLTIWWLIVTFDFYRHLRRRSKAIRAEMKRYGLNQRNQMFEYHEEDLEPADYVQLIRSHRRGRHPSHQRRQPSFIPRRLPFVTSSSEEQSSYSQRALAEFEANFDDEKSLAKLNNSNEKKKKGSADHTSQVTDLSAPPSRSGSTAMDFSPSGSGPLTPA